MEENSYDPRIRSLISGSRERWGDPETNKMGLVPFGIDIIDEAVWGLDIVNGDLVMIIGKRKDRKTTFVNNCLINWMTAKRPAMKPTTVYDVLESGSPPEKVSDSLLCNLASRYLIRDGHNPRGICKICHAPCYQLTLCPEYLLYSEKTSEQNKAIDEALATMSGWPLEIYGPAPKKGRTRDLDVAVDRWKKLISSGARIFIVDHMQQYSRKDRMLSSFEKQNLVVERISEIVAEYNVVFIVLSQVSLTSIRDARMGGGELIAVGGERSTQEANLQFTITYIPEEALVKAEISATRRSTSFKAGIAVEVVSGAFYGPTHSYDKKSTRNKPTNQSKSIK